MMRQVGDVAVFEVRGPLAHFRRPDTLGTHATYPFMTRTACHGLMASILGLERLDDAALCGIQLLTPVRSVTQEMSLHGKTWEAGSGNESSFSRPTSVELLVNPFYRIYYAGKYSGDLQEHLVSQRTHYHTYLGSAYCLTFPRWCGLVSASEVQLVNPDPSTVVETSTVVPAKAVNGLVTGSGCQYARVGGVLYQYLGNRAFRGSMSLLYEPTGKSLLIYPKANSDDLVAMFIQLPDFGTVCLW